MFGGGRGERGRNGLHLSAFVEGDWWGPHHGVL